MSNTEPFSERSVDVDQEDGTHVVYNEMGEEDLTVTIALALAEVGDVPPTETIPQFAEYVDPDGLNRLFAPLPNGDIRQGGPLHLVIKGFDLRIFSSGRVEIDA